MSVSPRVFRVGKTVFDLMLLAIALGFSFVLRFEGAVPDDFRAVFWASLPIVLIIQLCSLLAFKVPYLTWRYSSLRESLRLFLALSSATALLLAWRAARHVALALPTLPPAHEVPMPYGVLLIDLPLGFLALVGTRVGTRFWWEAAARWRYRRDSSSRVPTLLIGAGRTGAFVAGELVSRPDLGMHPVGFLDDDPRKRGTRIQGVRILGPLSDLQAIVRRYGVRQALLTTSRTGGTTLWSLAKSCEACGITAKIIPDVNEIVEGRFNFGRIRNVDIDDILHRPPAQLDKEAIADIIEGKCVLITGAGGSIGSELCRVVCRFRPEKLILVEKAENNLFQINWKLGEEFPETPLIASVADICDGPRMDQILERHKPDVLLHAAAHKHVPLMERNPGEAIKNNVVGTRGLADLAHAHGVGVFVMISTDKAVRPTSVMGVSKRIAELYIQALSQRSDTRFVAVRFGNVLGSVGSVVPIFKDQIARGGPVTVTHPDMERFFMTIPEACQLVLQAASMGRGGEIFILDMGQPVKIVDLARDLIRISGLRPDDDIEIRFTGIRPGEKLYEELALREEGATKTGHPQIYVGRIAAQDKERIARQIMELRKLVESPDVAAIHAKCAEIVPEYQVPMPPAFESNSIRRDNHHGRMAVAGSGPHLKRHLTTLEEV